MELYSDFKEMSNANIKVKLKEIGNEYEFIKQEILKCCDKLKVLEETYNKANEELKRRGL